MRQFVLKFLNNTNSVVLGMVAGFVFLIGLGQALEVLSSNEAIVFSLACILVGLPIAVMLSQQPN